MLRHTAAMRRLIPLACLAVAACSGNQTGVPSPSPVVARPVQGGALVGQTRTEITRLFGIPALTVTEGAGTKLQYRGRACVLDVYVYPPATGSGEARVAHVDARDRDGRDLGQASCVGSILAR